MPTIVHLGSPYLLSFCMCYIAQAHSICVLRRCVQTSLRMILLHRVSMPAAPFVWSATCIFEPSPADTDQSFSLPLSLSRCVRLRAWTQCRQPCSSLALAAACSTWTMPHCSPGGVTPRRCDARKAAVVDAGGVAPLLRTFALGIPELGAALLPVDSPPPAEIPDADRHLHG